VSHLGHLTTIDSEQDHLLTDAAQSYAWAWETHFSQEHDPSQVLGEQNIFRYRACPVLLRIGETAVPVQATLMLLAATAVHQPITLSVHPAQAAHWQWLDAENNMTVLVQSEKELEMSLLTSNWERMRLVGQLDEATRRAANKVGTAVVNQAVLANGRLELRHYLREQAISHTTHRYGNLMKAGK
jgi:RHH-type proline utilization regulon transcriptional repressor/proline dehydrogenase/delta 1-pyrroline-5-carboxylate dehydrogenase